jgi:cell division septation protein DedD
VSELSHDTAEDGFHEIQLNGKELVFLFIMVTLVSVAIFLCGVLVGRGARAVRGEDQTVEAAAQPAPAPAVTPDATPAPAAVAATEPPPAAAETPDELSYHKRLQAANAPAEELKPRAAEPPPAPAAAPASPPVAAATAGSTAAPPVTDVPTSGRPGTFVIQIQALRDREVAASLVKRLAGRGYPAFLVSPVPGGASPFFKVQVGRYAQRGEAEDVKRRLEKEEQFKPWITQ